MALLKTLQKLRNWRSIHWIRILFILIVFVASFQLLRDVSGSINLGVILADSPFKFISQILGASYTPSVNDFKLISDNYSRCQNKLGVNTGFNVSTSFTLASQTNIYDELDKYFRDGAKYYMINVQSVNMDEIQDIATLVNIVASSNLVPVIVIGSGDNNNLTTADKISQFYTQLTDLIGDYKFIGTTSPQTKIDQDKDYKGSLVIAASVAGNFASNTKFTTAPPILTVREDRDDVTEMKNAGLDLNQFDTILVGVENSDSKYGNGTSLAKARGYYYFSHGESSARSWIEKYNNDNKLNMTAIIGDFGATGGTENQPDHSNFIQRMAYDFGSFSDDQLVAGVILNQSKVGDGLTDDDLKTINLAGTNCNYDLVDYKDDYRSTAAASPTSGNTNSSSGAKVSARFVCGGQTCAATLYFTRQIGLPIRQFGSTSMVGTDTNKYTSIPALVSTVNSDTNDYYNQYAGVISGGNDDYTIPWLGSAIYAAAEGMKTQIFNPQNAWEAMMGTTQALMPWQSQAEFKKELENGRSIWAYIQGTGTKSKVTDENTLCSGKNCFSKSDYPSVISSLQAYDPISTVSTFEQTNNGLVQRVKDDPQNMIYGSEQIIDTQEWKDSAGWFCYQAYRGEDGIVIKGNLDCQMVEDMYPGRIDTTGSNPAHTSSNLYTYQNYVTLIGTSIPGKCNEYQDPHLADIYDPLTGTVRQQLLPGGPLLTVDNIKNGSCTADKSVISRYLMYKAGADTYKDSEVVLQKEMPSTPQYKIDGAYDALAVMYKNVQNLMGQRNQKIIFNEGWGWKSEIITKAYTKPNESGGVGINLASGAGTAAANAKEIADIGYGLAQFLTYGTSESDDVKGLNALCDVSVTPVIRSCSNGSCPFNDVGDAAAGGNAQGEYLAKVINASTCGQVYAVCGHNEPEIEYRDAGKGSMQDEGVWSRSCLNTLSQRSQKALVTTPIFNATYGGDDSQNVSDFISGYGATAFETDKSKFACLALNTYSFVIPPLDGSIPPAGTPVASLYYSQMISIPAFSGMKVCINETGQFTPDAPEPLKTQYNTATVNDLYRVGGGNLEYVLGFNWTGYNADKAFEYIILADKGRSLMQNVHTANSDLFKIQAPRQNNMLENFNTDTTPAYDIPGEYLGTQKYYLADGSSYSIQNQYYPMLGFLDELDRLYVVLASQSGLPSGQLSLVNNQLHLSTGLAENYALLPSCDESWVKALPDNKKVNCLGTTQTVDPLGQFLCAKGYDLGEGKCNLICVEAPGDNGDLGNSGSLTCNLNTTDVNDTISWESVSSTINIYLNKYNLDSNDSKTWIANLGTGEDPQFAADHAERARVTQAVIDEAKAQNLNPRLAITLWMEETAGSAAGQRGLGCLGFRGVSRTVRDIPGGLSADQMIDLLKEQVDCVASYVKEFPNFNQFMCTYSGEPGRPDCTAFVTNANFPVNVCSIYNRLGGTATDTPSASTSAQASTTTSTTRTTLKSISQVQSGLVSLTDKIEKNMCLPHGTLLAMMEREITGTISSVTGDPFQKINEKANYAGASGPAQFTNIAWIGTGYGKIGATGFVGNKGNYKYGTQKCLDALGIPYQGDSSYFELPVINQVLNRSYVGYALCGSAAKLKNDSYTAAKETSANTCDRDWTADEVKAAARAYLGDCSQNNRPYCDIYIDTICTLYPQDNPTLCAGRPGSSSSGDLVIVGDSKSKNLICDYNDSDGIDVPECLDGKIRFINPLGYDKSYRITQIWGGSAEHSGLDMGASIGDPVYAGAAGEIVAMASNCTYLPDAPALSLNCNYGAGNYVKIKHTFGSTVVWTVYEHFVKLADGISEGQRVKAGDLLGYIGMTGNTSGPHLHFEVRKNDCYDGYHDGAPFGSCSIDPALYIENASGFAQCSGGGDTISGDYVCPIQNKAAASIYQYSSGCTPSHPNEPCYGSHSLTVQKFYHQHEQLPTDIRAPNQMVVAPTDGVVTEIRTPRDTVAAYGPGICDYIRVGDGNSSNNSGVNTNLVEALNLHESPAGSGIYVNKAGKKIYDSTIDDEGEFKYDGGFVVTMTDASGVLWRFVHVKPINGESFVFKVGDTITKGQVIAQVYNGQLSGEWAAWSVVSYQGSGCFDTSNPHLHFAIIDANAAKNEANYYAGNTIDSTPWVKKYCGIN